MPPTERKNREAITLQLRFLHVAFLARRCLWQLLPILDKKSLAENVLHGLRNRRSAVGTGLVLIFFAHFGIAKGAIFRDVNSATPLKPSPLTLATSCRSVAVAQRRSSDSVDRSFEIVANTIHALVNEELASRTVMND